MREKQKKKDEAAAASAAGKWYAKQETLRVCGLMSVLIQH